MNSKNNHKNHKKQNNRRAGKTSLTNQVYAPSFPRSMAVNLKYTEMINITLTTSLAFDYLFNLNSIFDPNRSGTGHQPQAHDQWATFYNRYRVDKIHCKLLPCGSTSTHGQRFTIFPSNSTTGITAYDQATEMPYAKSAVCITTGSTRGSLIATYDLATIAGVNKTIYQSDDRYQAAFGSSPTEALCLHVVVEDGAFSNPSVYYSVELTFQVVLSDPLQLGLS